MYNKFLRYVSRCFLCIALCLIAPHAGITAVPQYDVRLFHDESFSKEQEKFFPFDTIYTVVDFSDMQPGDYTIDIDWIQPDGKLVRNSSHPFTLSEKMEAYRVFFWLKLHAKGPLGQLVSGDEYTSSVYGRWKVQVSFNGEQLSPTSFVVSDDIM